jgi:hypothetical protein
MQLVCYSVLLLLFVLVMYKALHRYCSVTKRPANNLFQIVSQHLSPNVKKKAADILLYYCCEEGQLVLNLVLHASLTQKQNP